MPTPVHTKYTIVWSLPQLGFLKSKVHFLHKHGIRISRPSKMWRLWIVHGTFQRWPVRDPGLPLPLYFDLPQALRRSP